jgi:hypothetical protein
MTQELIHIIAKELITEGWSYKDLDSPEFDSSAFNNNVVSILDFLISLSPKIFFEMEKISKKL